jgi:RNA polymerase sigma factor for flagellar operon FliA
VSGRHLESEVQRTSQTSPPPTASEARQLRLYRQVREASRGCLGRLVQAELRRSICDQHVPLVTRISRQFRFRRFDGTVSEFELQSAGMIGLMKAVDMFDEQVGSSFVAYAAQRVRGEMLDWLREVDPYSRDVRRLERVTSRLIRADGRPPSEEDLADELDVTVDRVRRLRENRRVMVTQSLDEYLGTQDNPCGGRRCDLIGDDSMEDPSTTVSQDEMIQVCRDRLSGREEKVFFENALDGRSLKEIGDELGISESRACQIRRTAREKLAQFLVGRGEVPPDWLDAFDPAPSSGDETAEDTAGEPPVS